MSAGNGGRGPAPKVERVRDQKPSRGDWKSLDVVGWQHGPVPECPDGLGETAQFAWDVWMHSWVAAHWGEEDLPALLTLIDVYNDVMEVGHLGRAAELRMEMEIFGLTPKGRQDRRWHPPEAAKPEKVKVKPKTRRRLEAVGE